MLQSYRDVEALEGYKLKNLREVVFGRNPVYDREAKKGEAGLTGYRTKMKQIFPTIQMLDMIPFEAEIALPEIGLPSVDDLPETEKGSFMDSEITANMFVGRFFGLFDSNRPALSDVYMENSHFSVSVNPNLRRIRPGGVKAGGREMFDTWFPHNRNHLACKDAGKRVSLLAKGNQAIDQLFCKLPQTKHPINASFEKKMFACDAYQQQMGDGVVLVLTVQGEFNEVLLSKTKSFTRTFVLIPAPPGSRASQTGWDVCILNDILVVRSWAADRTWSDKPISQISSQPTNGPLVGVAHGARAFDANQLNNGGASSTTVAPGGGASGGGGALPNDLNVLLALKNAHGLDDAKHNIVVQLAQATGLNYQFAAQCLNEVGWNGDAAMGAFNSVRDGTKQVVEWAFPHWNVKEAKFKLQTHGLTKTYGKGTDAIIDRDQEMIKLSSEQDETDVRHPQKSVLVARHMAKWHKVDAKDLVEPKERLFETYNQWLSEVPKQFSKPSVDANVRAFITVERLKKELLHLEFELAKFASPLVFSHGDVNPNNIIYNSTTERVDFIDYEYGSYNPRGFDIGNHFCEHAGFDCEWDLYPDKEFQRKFLRAYLEAWNEGEGEKTVTEEEVNKLYAEVNKYSLAANLGWAIWGLVQAEISDLDFDYTSYSKLRLDEYFRRKDEFLKL
ncbi:UNVERIFIED_CONTAM: Ethanolamine kinase 1 [Siphonaria sp. JEL0065]|nr:Ethanolamine kinase 1 [Siphonaria sp. JEL0065]